MAGTRDGGASGPTLPALIEPGETLFSSAEIRIVSCCRPSFSFSFDEAKG